MDKEITDLTGQAFPGEFAGASLKLRQFELRLSDCAPFPGEFAGASLKRAVLDLVRGVVERHSPLSDPLIFFVRNRC